MKRFIRITRSSIGSLGAFGLILFLITLIVVTTWLSVAAVDQTSNAIYNELIKLTLLKDEISYHLLAMDINADYYDFSGGDSDYQSKYQIQDDSLREKLSELSSDTGGFLEADENYYKELLLAIDAHNQAFDHLQQAVISGNPDEISAAQTDLTNEVELAQKIITDWTYQVEARYNKALEETDTAILGAVINGMLGLACLPFLAFWAFSLVSDITQPMLILSDTLTSIQGGRFQSERLTEVIERKDNLGKFARDIELMYAQVTRQREALENELAALQQQLKEKRRRQRR